jgi:Reverse transcriptase (RNA-dependent DNA polymerase)
VPSNQVTTTPIPLKWVFKYKPDSNEYVTRYRSRLVIRGDLQEESSILSTYAATLAARSFRVASAIAAHFDLEMKQFDVVNAFINAERDSNRPMVACKLPDGFKVPGYVTEVDRVLYGLRDSPALWFKHWTTTLKSIDLVGLKEEPCIFVDADHKVFVVFYVDDFQVLYHKVDEARAQSIIERIKRVYDLHDMRDVKWFLGVRVIRDRQQRKLWLVHDAYIEKIAKKFNLIDGKCPTTPLPGYELRKFSGKAHPHQVKLYQEKVGSLLYTAIMIRADVAYTASLLSQFLTNPAPEYFTAVDWALRYLFGTRFLAIQYDGESRETQLLIASDASFADDPDTRRSSHGYVITLFGGLILWRVAR